MSTTVFRYGNWVVKYRLLIVLITVLFVTASAIGLSRLEMNMDGRLFFGENNPQLEALDSLETIYTKSESIFIAISPANGNVFTKENLAAVFELTESCWKIPYSNRVDSITNFQHVRSENDELIINDLVEEVDSLSAEDLSRIRRIALSEPLLVNRLISSNGSVTGINVNIIKANHSIKEIPEITEFTRQLIERLKNKYPGIRIYLAGDILIDASFAEAAEKDIKTLIPIMLMVLFLILCLTLRSFIGVLVSSFVLIFSVLTGMGLAGWFNISLNPSSANAPVVILTLAVADSVHLLASFFQFVKEGKSNAVEESLRVNLLPVFLTSLTTVIGFLSMNLSESPPFGDLGNIVALGVAAAFVYSIMFLPALMAILPVSLVKWKQRPDSNFSSHLSKIIIRRRNVLLWTMIVSICLTCIGVSRVELNDDFLKYFDTRFEFRRSCDFIMDNLTGLATVEYSLNSGKDNGINDPHFLHTVDAFVNWFKTQPNVVHVSSLTEIVKKMNKSFHDENPEYFQIPDSTDVIAQYLLLYELSLPFGQDINHQINVSKSSTRLIVTLGDVTTREILQTDANAQTWLRENAHPSMATIGTSISTIWAHIAERNIKSMIWASFWALFTVSLILSLAFRSIKYGALTLLPNCAPALMAFGVWGMAVQTVGLAASVIAAFTIGIVVDDTIHFMTKYLRARREKKLSVEASISYTFEHVVKAILITSIALSAGFIVLSFSGFKINAELGLLSAVTIMFALILDVVLLPCLLLKIDS